MQMILVIDGGALLLALFLLFGMLWGGAALDYALATKAFIPVWASIACANMWVGVTKAGYSVRDELPILLIVVAISTVLATTVVWRVAR